MNAGPKPSPAIAVPTNRTAAVPVSIEANVAKAPMMRSRQPPSITTNGFFLASKAEAAAPRPVSRNIRMPPQSKFFECSSCAASDGPSDRKKPATARVHEGRHRRGKGTPGRARHADMRPQRTHNPGPHRSRLWHRQYGDDADDESPE